MVRALRRRLRSESFWVLISFLATFIAARAVVFYIMYHDAPELYVRVGGTHVHHHVWGILLLAGLGLFMLLGDKRATRPRTAALLYGLALALTFDEFGMWLNMGGSYWQRASYDAVVMTAVVLSIAAVWPVVRLMRRRSSRVALVGMAVVALAGAVVFVQTYRFGGRKLSQLRELVEPSLATNDDPRQAAMTATD